jgi:cyclohexanone monooxygenase
MVDGGLDGSTGGAVVEHDAVVVGAGFAGLYALHRLRELGLSVRVLEQGGDVGGTWYWNRYPGARCDIESLDYSYSFSEDLQQEWEWSERFATQPEILRYVSHVAERFDLRRDIEFDTTVISAAYDEGAGRWLVTTEAGAHHSARWLIMATGCLSVARKPDFPGLDLFRGRWYHTGAWPHEGVDFTGLRVGVIGTGSSAIQSIPLIAEQAASLTVFQRTPNYSIPARNGPLAPEVVRDLKARYAEHRQEARYSRGGVPRPVPTRKALEVDEETRLADFRERWEHGGLGFLAGFTDLGVDEAANDTAAEFVRERIREIVRDPEVAERLLPRGYPIGTKRLCVDTGYYATFNRDNVTLVDVRTSPIVEITEQGVRTTDGEHEFDAIVFATGFDAMTGPLLRVDISGRGGRSLRDEWSAGPRSYLGLAVNGFPNLFTVTGPGSPSVLSNMMVSIEQHVEWIADCLAHLRDHDLQVIEAEAEAQDEWVDHVNEVADRTLHPRAASWYMGANIPGKPQVFMPYIGGVGAYRERCERVAAAGYKGFVLS